MSGAITFTLDGQEVTARPGETIWDVAQRHGVEIPHACLSTDPDFRPEGNCRLCVVEVEGYRTLQPSCLMRSPRDVIVAPTASAPFTRGASSWSCCWPMRRSILCRECGRVARRWDSHEAAFRLR